MTRFPEKTTPDFSTGMIFLSVRPDMLRILFELSTDRNDPSLPDFCHLLGDDPPARAREREIRGGFSLRLPHQAGHPDKVS